MNERMRKSGAHCDIGKNVGTGRLQPRCDKCVFYIFMCVFTLLHRKLPRPSIAVRLFLFYFVVLCALFTQWRQEISKSPRQKWGALCDDRSSPGHLLCSKWRGQRCVRGPRCLGVQQSGSVMHLSHLACMIACFDDSVTCMNCDDESLSFRVILLKNVDAEKDGAIAAAAAAAAAPSDLQNQRRGIVAGKGKGMLQNVFHYWESIKFTTERNGEARPSVTI
jgi:hypothetical protein